MATIKRRGEKPKLTLVGDSKPQKKKKLKRKEKPEPKVPLRKKSNPELKQKKKKLKRKEKVAPKVKKFQLPDALIPFTHQELTINVVKFLMAFLPDSFVSDHNEAELRKLSKYWEAELDINILDCIKDVSTDDRFDYCLDNIDEKHLSTWEGLLAISILFPSVPILKAKLCESNQKGDGDWELSFMLKNTKKKKRSITFSFILGGNLEFPQELINSVYPNKHSFAQAQYGSSAILDHYKALSLSRERGDIRRFMNQYSEINGGEEVRLLGDNEVRVDTKLLVPFIHNIHRVTPNGGWRLGDAPLVAVPSYPLKSDGKNNYSYIPSNDVDVKLSDAWQVVQIIEGIVRVYVCKQIHQLDSDHTLEIVVDGSKLSNAILGTLIEIL